MLGEDHFKLQLVRLQPSEVWTAEIKNEDTITFVFVKGGVGKYVSQTVSQRLAGGDVFVFAGNAGGKLVTEEKSDCLFSSFSVYLEHLFPLFAAREISLLHNVRDGFKAGKVYAKNHPVAMECVQLLEADSAQSELEHRSQLLRIVAAVLAGEFKNVKAQRAGFIRTEDNVIQMFEKISSRELLSLSVDELAAKFSCSRRHLNRLFHQHFGLSIAALKMEMRLLKAVSLLRDPEAKVINVAEQCGFNHLGLFNTCFKRRYGTSPGQWRKSILSAENPAGKPAGGCPLHVNGLCPWGGGQPASSAGQTGKAQIAEISPVAVARLRAGASTVR